MVVHIIEVVFVYIKILGRWTELERLKYAEFADENLDILDKHELCYQYRIYR